MLGIGLLLLGKLLLAAQLLIFLLRHFPSRRRVAAAPPTCGTAWQTTGRGAAGGRGGARAAPRRVQPGTYTFFGSTRVQPYTCGQQVDLASIVHVLDLVY